MTPSSQTTADLAFIIETLDQRIHELNSERRADTHEAGQLGELREHVAQLCSAR